MTELETSLIQEWRDQSGRFASSKSEEKMRADNQNTGKVKQNEQMVTQLNAMAEQIKKLTLE